MSFKVSYSAHVLSLQGFKKLGTTSLYADQMLVLYYPEPSSHHFPGKKKKKKTTNTTQKPEIKPK